MWEGMMFELVRGGKPCCAIVVGSGTGDEGLAELLAQRVEDLTGVRVPLIGDEDAQGDRNFIHLGTLLDDSRSMEILRENRCMVRWEDREVERNKRLNTPADLGSQGFVFHMVRGEMGNRLILGGHTEQGTLYAAVTAMERLCLEGDRLLIKYIDTILQPRFNVPLFEGRSVATNLGGPDWLGPGQWAKEWRTPDGRYDWKGFVDLLAGHKLNNLSCWIFNLAFGIAYDSPRFPTMVNRHHPNVEQEFMSDLMAYAEKRHVDVWFFLDFPDNWAGVIRARPYFAGRNVDLEQFPTGEAWARYAEGDDQARAVRRSVSWVCGSEPGVKEFWRMYLTELVERYPNVRGIGGQFCEHSGTRCTCPICSERFFEIQEEFFEEMVKTVQARNSDIIPWIYDSWGTREIVRCADRYPHFVNVDWGSAEDCLKFYSRRQIPRGTWYLQHASGSRWREHLLRIGTRTLAASGVSGYQIRGVSYREQDEMYHAAQEFAWNPALTDEGFARLHIIRRYHRDDEALARLYASWIRLNGRREALGHPDAVGWMDRDREQIALREERMRFEAALGVADRSDGFVAGIAGAFEENRKEFVEEE